MSDSESEGGGGALHSYPGIKIPTDSGTVPRVSTAPSEGPEEGKATRDPDRNTHTPRSPETGPESKRTQASSGICLGPENQAPPCRHHSQELIVQDEEGVPPPSLPQLSTYSGHTV